LRGAVQPRPSATEPFAWLGALSTDAVPPEVPPGPAQTPSTLEGALRGITRRMLGAHAPEFERTLDATARRVRRDHDDAALAAAATALPGALRDPVQAGLDDAGARVARAPWFKGTLDRDTAYGLCMSELSGPRGRFAIGRDEGAPGPFYVALARADDAGPVHLPLQQAVDGRFTIRGVDGTFDDLHAVARFVAGTLGYDGVEG
jgi:hypothetical protein